jgi:RNA polymerase sigma factor (sigma-70 family)
MVVSKFNIQALKELTDQQVRFAPPAKRQEQLERAEKLLAEIEVDRQYPYPFVCFRITEYRPDSYSDLLIRGEDLRHDLALFIAELTYSLAVENAEPMLTLDEISKQLNVSTKTISRWRERGLVGHEMVCNGRRLLGFPQSVVDRFVARNRERVQRGSRFSQLSEEEKEEILRRARRLARLSTGTLTEISRRIGRRLGRSTETVRYTIKNFDRQHPDQALFPAVTGLLDMETKQAIYNAYRRKIKVDTLAKRFRRTRTSIYRVINEMRAQHLLEQPLEYIYHPDFDNPAMEPVILAPMPNEEAFWQQKEQMRVPKDVPVELMPCYEWPLLSKEQEQHLFRQMNFLKYRASQLRAHLRLPTGKINPARARTPDLDRIEGLQRQAQEVKERLIKCNLRLVVSIAKKHAAQTDNFWELLSDGNMSLIRAVEKFDYGRGNKFSTYASWAIMKNFARSIPDEKHRRERFVTGHEDLFETAPDTRSNEQECLASQEQAVRRVNRLLEYLEPREREIIRMRAGLDNHSENMTLEEIGQQLGITKERVRQLNVRIMNKLKSIARDQQVDLP